MKRNRILISSGVAHRVLAGGVAAFVLLCHATLGQTIPNPSFETDTFTVFPGYISSNAPITGWTGTPPERVGLNPASGSPFANNGTIPAGNNVAFIQSNATDPGTPSTLSTTISGLTAGTTYKVTFRANATSTNLPYVKVYIDGAAVLLPGGPDGFSTAAVTGANAYWFVAFEFTAAAASQTLSIVNDATGDQTLLLDDFKIAPTSGRWTVAAWTGDADSGIDPTFFYTHAYNFGSAANASINNINFLGVAGGAPAVAGKFSTTFFGNLFTGDANSLTVAGGGSATLGTDFVYGGNVPATSFQSITLSGLTPGTNYVMTVYSVGWENPDVGIRWGTLSVGDDYLTVNQDQFLNDFGIQFTYRYTADASGTMTFRISPLVPANVSFHAYGFANREAVSRFVAPVISVQPQNTVVSPDVQAAFSVTASGVPLPTYQWRFGGTAITGATNSSYSFTAASTNAGLYDVIVANTAGSVTSQVARLTVGNISIVNASFEADSFSIFPGYVSGNFPITGWASLDNHGINPAAGSPFADNGIIPNGTQVAFMQGDGPFSQTVTGLTVGAQYYVHYYENARGGNTPALEVQVGGNTVVASHIITSVGGNPYREVSSSIFTASAADLVLSFIKSNPLGGDTTALIDNVAILVVPPGTPPSVTLQPQGGIFVEGDNVLLSVNVFGSQPITYQWKKNGSNLPGETGASLTLTSVTTNSAGDYSVAVTNSSGFAISSNATVTVPYRPIPGVFGTGVDANGALLAAGATDPHYILSASADAGFPGPNAIVINEGFPIPPWVANGPASKWIAPMADQAVGNAEGDYTYQTTFNLTGYDLSKVRVVGSWSVDNTGLDILVNGVSTGITSPGFGSYVSFTITSGLLAGANTLDFRINNAPATPNPTGLRVNLRGLLDLQPSQPTVTLQIGRSGNSVSISWSPTATGQVLQWAPSVTGPWTDIVGAPNPYITTTSETMRLYRIKQ